jgi:hypothetical protein
MRKTISILLTLILLLALLTGCNSDDQNVMTDSPTDALAETPTEAPTEKPTEKPIEKPTETPLEHFEYEISEGKSAVYINRYLGTDDYVKIPDFIEGLPVTAINGTQSKGAFEDSAVHSVSMPNTVSVIGKNAFKNCSEIEYIYFVSALREIGESAFENCSAIITCNLEFSALERIGERAFYGCTTIKRVYLPDTVSSIGDEAFANCSSLIDIELSDSLTEIGNSAFENCYSLERILIPSGVEMKDAGSPAFVGTPLLKTIVFEEGREEISGAPYFNLNSGADIYIPKSVKRVSLSPFIVEDNTPIELIFLGDCPELIETHEKLGDPTVYYDVRTSGWESCAWRDVYPIKENQYLFIDGKENEVWKNCLEYFISNRALKQIEEGVGSNAIGLMDVTLDGVPEIFLAYRGGSMGNRPFQIYDLRSAQKLGYYDGSVGGGIYPVKSSDGEVIWLSEGCFRDPDLGILDFLVRILPEFGERYLAADSLFHKAENRKDGKEAFYSVGNENKTLSKAEYYEEYGKFRDSHRRIPFAEMKLVEWNSIEAESKQEIASEMAEALLEGYVGVVPNDLLTDLQQ